MTIRDGDHANEFETSLMLHLIPELVDMATAEDGGYQAFRIPAIAGCVDDQVVATGTLGLYPSVTGAEVMAWIGMILVDEGMRGRGYGARLFTAMLDRAEALNVSLLGLDATDLGRLLYERHGFRDQQQIDRWIGLPATGGEGYPAACSTVRPMPASDIAAMRALDCAATGVDRTDMLCHLAGESAVTVLVDDGTGGLGGLGGFGMLQEGRVGRIVGPVVAADADGATRILHGLIRHAASVGPPHALVIDCLRPSPLAAALRSLGFSPARELWRMCCPPWRYVVNLSVSSPRIPQGKTPGHGSNSFGLVLHTETASTSPPWRHVSGVPNAAPSPTRCNRVATLESRATSWRTPPVRKPFCRAIVEKPAACRYQWAVSQPVKLSEELVLDARLTSAVAERSIAGQIEYWAQLGRAIEPLLQGAQALALRMEGAARPLSECLGSGQSAQTPQNRHSRRGCQAFRELL